MIKRLLVVSLLALNAVFASSCNDDDAPAGGPIDGAWTISTWTCNNGSGNVLAPIIASGVTSIVITFSNNSGSQVANIGSSCVATHAMSYTYSGSSVTMTTGAKTCSGCSGAQCTDEAAPTTNNQDTYTYSVSGNTLTLTRSLPAAVASDDPFSGASCTANQTETITATK